MLPVLDKAYSTRNTIDTQIQQANTVEEEIYKSLYKHITDGTLGKVFFQSGGDRGMANSIYPHKLQIPSQDEKVVLEITVIQTTTGNGQFAANPNSVGIRLGIVEKTRLGEYLHWSRMVPKGERTRKWVEMVDLIMNNNRERTNTDKIDKKMIQKIFGNG